MIRIRNVPLINKLFINVPNVNMEFPSQAISQQTNASDANSQNNTEKILPVNGSLQAKMKTNGTIDN